MLLPPMLEAHRLGFYPLTLQCANCPKRTVAEFLIVHFSGQINFSKYVLPLSLKIDSRVGESTQQDPKLSKEKSSDRNGERGQQSWMPGAPEDKTQLASSLAGLKNVSATPGHEVYLEQLIYYFSYLSLNTVSTAGTLENILAGPQNLTTELPGDPALPLLYGQKTHTCKLCNTSIHIAARVSKRAKRGKEPKRLSANRQMKQASK